MFSGQEKISFQHLTYARRLVGVHSDKASDGAGKSKWRSDQVYLYYLGSAHLRFRTHVSYFML